MKTLAVLLLTGLAGLAQAAQTGPNQVVEETVDRLSAKIDGRRDELAADPPALYALVNEIFLPVFDTDYAGRLVLGRHWRTASPEQRQRFIDTFYDFLLRSYAKHVLDFQKDKVRILPPPPGDPDPRRSVVRTEMRLPDGTTVPVHYSLRLTDEGWRAFDVRIEGISYVQNYRNQFNAEIGSRGIEAVIARLEKEAAEIDAGIAEEGEAE